MINDEDFQSLEKDWRAAQEAQVENIPEPSFPANLPKGAVPIPVSEDARHIAARLSSGQDSREAIEATRLRLLAVLAVRDYLAFQGYIPDLETSDCWNPMLLKLQPCGDLVVSQIGRIECCPFMAGQAEYTVPMDGQSDRVSYVAVELDAEECWVWLIGFVAVDSEDGIVTTVKRQELVPMDNLGELLRRRWLLWQILEKVDEPWDKDVRSEVCRVLERIYETSRPFKRAGDAKKQIEALLSPEVIATSGAVRGSKSWSNEDEVVLPERMLNDFRNIFSELAQKLNES